MARLAVRAGHNRNYLLSLVRPAEEPLALGFYDQSILNLGRKTRSS
jgi:hypothetical protein